jgi:cytochrome P450
MKIGGKEIQGPSESVVVIPRQSGNVVFKARAVLELDEFDKTYPAPNPPEILTPGGGKGSDPNDAEYLKLLSEWGDSKAAWMVLKSLEPSQIVWDTVTMSDPKTWGNYRTELLKSFTPGEVAKIISIVNEANGLDDAKIREATESFLALPAAAPKA